MLDHSVRDNLLLPLLRATRQRRASIDAGKGRRLADRLIEQFAVKAGEP